MLSDWSYYLIIIAALFDVGVLSYIYSTKRHGGKLICRSRNDCMSVVSGPYSNILGMPNELLGIAYHLAIALYGVVGVLDPSLILPISHLVLIVSSVAALFALYLLYLQAFVIRRWCDWCVVSGVASIAIFYLIAFA